MDLQSVLSELEASGTEQDRAELAGQGVTGPMYGVHHGALGAFRDKIGTDHSLAASLWETGNHDARMLATLVADVNQVDDAFIEAWSADAHDSVLWGAVQTLADRVRPMTSSASESAATSEATAGASPVSSAPRAKASSKISKKAGGKKPAKKKAPAKKGKAASSKKKSASGKKKGGKPAKKGKGKAAKKSGKKKTGAKKVAKKVAKKTGKKSAKKSKARKK